MLLMLRCRRIGQINNHRSSLCHCTAFLTPRDGHIRTVTGGPREFMPTIWPPGSYLEKFRETGRLETVVRVLFSLWVCLLQAYLRYYTQQSFTNFRA